MRKSRGRNPVPGHARAPMSASRKKVVLRKLSRDWLAGYLPPSGFVEDGSVPLLELAGTVVSVPLAEIKWICFVRDFNSGEAANPERLLRKNFTARPRAEGLWMRLRLRDGDQIEGLAANDGSLIAADGLLLTPPDTRSNTQQVFVPRTSVEELEVLAVIGAPAARRRPQPAQPADPAQESLFAPPQ